MSLPDREKQVHRDKDYSRNHMHEYLEFDEDPQWCIVIQRMLNILNKK